MAGRFRRLDAVLAKGRDAGEKIAFLRYWFRSLSTLKRKPAHCHMQVRRLTLRECERLQGFPDDYTRIPERFYKAKPHGKHFEKYPTYTSG